MKISFDPWLYLTTLAAETKKLGTQFIEGQPIEVCWKQLNDSRRQVETIMASMNLPFRIFHCRLPKNFILYQ